MITSIRFENFKGFEQLELNDLTPIVLISGRNNAGKTSVLEGLFLYIDYKAADSFLKLNNFRGVIYPVTSNVIWESAFNNSDINKTMKITVVDDGVESALSYSVDKNYVPTDANVHPEVLNQFVVAAKNNYSLKYEFIQKDYEETGHLSISGAGILCNSSVKDNKAPIEMKHAQFINNMIASNDVTINDWFGKSELEGEKESVVDALRLIEPRLLDIRVISINGQPTLYANINGKLLPLKLCGDGINRLLYIILSIKENRDAVIFIDEIETGFHYSIYPKIWEIVAKVAKDNNCQIFATTHSIECIHGAVEGICEAGLKSSFSYYRLDRNGHTVSHRFSYDMLNRAISSDMEVR